MSSCAECEASYEQSRPDHRYCCERCQRKAEKRRYRQRHAGQTKCKGCGAWFRAPTTDGKAKVYCSTKCQYATRSHEYQRRLDIGRPNLGITAYNEALRNDPCAYCGEPATEIDHIHPRSSGGPDSWENYAGVCKTCNARKGRRSMLNFMLARPAMKQIATLKAEIPAVDLGGDPNPACVPTAGVAFRARRTSHE